eukprot:7388465-Prymnesium_polylepis.2
MEPVPRTLCPLCAASLTASTMSDSQEMGRTRWWWSVSQVVTHVSSALTGLALTGWAALNLWSIKSPEPSWRSAHCRDQRPLGPDSARTSANSM